MTTQQGRRGRPSRPYPTSWGADILGLAKDTDGRWRIVATGERFTESDERRAVQRFLAWQQENQPTPVNIAFTPQSLADLTSVAPVLTVTQSDDEPPRVTAALPVSESDLWAWAREKIISNPVQASKMLGIPEVASLASLPLPQPSLKLTDIIDQYNTHAPALPKTKREAVAFFNRLITFASADTLDDLTQEKLLVFRAEIEADTSLTSASTRKNYYGRIRTIIAFGLKVGLNEPQIRGALNRCKVLWTAESMPAKKPQPISREDFHTLLSMGGKQWRPWLLLGLNLAMTFEDLCELRWQHFDMAKGTYAAYRVKTRKKKIPRAGVLWPETMAELTAIGRTGESPYVFTSSHGSRYNSGGRGDAYADIRKAAGLPESLTFKTLRAGAYTAAFQGVNDEKIARVLAGHKAAGLQDHYVLRTPEITRSACEAVYAAYGPF